MKVKVNVCDTGRWKAGDQQSLGSQLAGDISDKHSRMVTLFPSATASLPLGHSNCLMTGETDMI